MKDAKLSSDIYQVTIFFSKQNLWLNNFIYDFEGLIIYGMDH